MNGLHKAQKLVRNGEKKFQDELECADILLAHMNEGKPARTAALSRELLEVAESWFLLTMKKVVYAANIAEGDVGKDESELPLVQKVRQIAEADVVMPVMHGMNGEDGTLQGMLELWNIPYTSSGVLGSALGMDKIAMKRMFKACGFPVLKDVCVERSEWKRNRAGVLSRVMNELSFPVYVKPSNLGSSIGINRADNKNGLEDAIDIAVSYDRRVQVETGIQDLMEINCAVLGYGGDAMASVTEMPVRWSDFLSFDEKYLRGAKGGAKGTKGAPSKGMSSLSRQMPAPISPPDPMA